MADAKLFLRGGLNFERSFYVYHGADASYRAQKGLTWGGEARYGLVRFVGQDEQTIGIYRSASRLEREMMKVAPIIKWKRLDI